MSEVLRSSISERREGASEILSARFREIFGQAAELLGFSKKGGSQFFETSRLASQAIGKFYRQVKKVGCLVPFLLIAGEKPGDYKNQHQEESIITSEIDRDNLSFSLALVDTFFPDLIEVYNKCIKFKAARIDNQMSEEEIIFKEGIAQRVIPVDYFVLDPLQSRLEQAQEGKNRFTKEFLEKEGSMFDRVRFDLFRKYLGLPQFFDIVQPATYRPEQETDSQAKYFQFDPIWVVQSILETRGQNLPLPNVEQPKESTFSGSTFEDLYGYVQKNAILPSNEFTGHLGEYKAYVGFDQSRGEKYVSYYDNWDVDPPQLKVLGLDIDQFNFPFELYGRIYESDFTTLERLLSENH